MDSRIDTFANRLDIAMKKNNVNQIELSEKTKLYPKPISQSLINKYLKGKAFARQNNIYILCKILDVDEAWLMGFDVPMERTPDEFRGQKTKLDKFGNPVVSIPLLGTVKAGYDYLAQENWEGTVDIKEELAKTGEFFALKIKGDSMFETLWENDIVAVKKQDFAENNQIVVAIVNGNEATVKMYKNIPGGIMLQPLNRKYDDLIFTEKQIKETPVKIIGVVKQILERNF